MHTVSLISFGSSMYCNIVTWSIDDVLILAGSNSISATKQWKKCKYFLNFKLVKLFFIFYDSKNTEYKVLNYKYGDHTTTTYYYVYKAGVIDRYI